MNSASNRGEIAGELVEARADEQRAPHITVCICTYKRPHALRRLLEHLATQVTEGLFTWSVVVVDNEDTRAAEATVAELAASYPVPIRYDVEPRRNIALARNRTVVHARGEYLALIDDDEFPVPEWLLLLYRTLVEYRVDGVLGPVIRHFEETPPRWFQKSRIYSRRVNPTGMAVCWQESRTSNVLVKSCMMTDAMPFRPEFRAGEDQDFFRRKIEEGFSFIWSAEARVYETIPPARWKRSYILRKAALQGATAAIQPNCGPVNIAKSIIAIPLYTVCLPFALLLGQHRFMALMAKIADHGGKLLYRMGINPIKEEYVSE